MSDRAYVIRFPDGDYEYAVTSSPAPTVGTTIERKRASWKVTEVVRGKPTTIYVARVASPAKASRS